MAVSRLRGVIRLRSSTVARKENVPSSHARPGARRAFCRPRLRPPRTMPLYCPRPYATAAAVVPRLLLAVAPPAVATGRTTTDKGDKGAPAPCTLPPARRLSRNIDAVIADLIAIQAIVSPQRSLPMPRRFSSLLCEALSLSTRATAASFIPTLFSPSSFRPLSSRSPHKTLQRRYRQPAHTSGVG